MLSKNNKFLLCAGGIFISYFYFGILQEKITRGKYVQYKVVDDEKVAVTEKYTYATTLVFVQCLINYIFAEAMLQYWKHGEDKTPHLYYGSSALTYFLAMICSNMALQWVPYPTQVVGKAAKPIPVMVLGVLVGKKVYPLKKYLFVLLIVLGVVLFMYKEKAAAAIDKETSFGLGEVLLILSLSMDGLTGAVQERMRAEAKPTGQQMMRGMNLWATCISAVALVLTGEAFQFTNFVIKYPFVLTNIALLALTGAIGQLFIFLMVSEFGPLPCSVVTTTRKFFTVLGSVLLFGNVLSSRQWIGAVIVFTGLFLDAFFAKGPPKKK